MPIRHGLMPQMPYLDLTARKPANAGAKGRKSIPMRGRGFNGNRRPTAGTASLHIAKSGPDAPVLAQSEAVVFPVGVTVRHTGDVIGHHARPFVASGGQTLHLFPI